MTQGLMGISSHDGLDVNDFLPIFEVMDDSKVDKFVDGCDGLDEEFFYYSHSDVSSKQAKKRDNIKTAIMKV